MMNVLVAILTILVIVVLIALFFGCCFRMMFWVRSEFGSKREKLCGIMAKSKLLTALLDIKNVSSLDELGYKKYTRRNFMRLAFLASNLAITLTYVTVCYKLGEFI